MQRISSQQALLALVGQQKRPLAAMRGAVFAFRDYLRPLFFIINLISTLHHQPLITRIVPLLILVWWVCSCAKRPVFVQFKNNTSEDFSYLRVDMLGNVFSFEKLRAGELTPVVAVPETYYYCGAKIITAKGTLEYRPIDFVGEKLFTSGKLITELNIDSVKNRKGAFVRRIHMDSERGRWLRRLRELRYR